MPVISNIVTSLAGRAVAQTIGGAAAGPVGMMLGAALPFVARRLGPLGMVGLAVGAWAVNQALAAQAKADAAKDKAMPKPLPDLQTAPDPHPHPGSALLVDRR